MSKKTLLTSNPVSKNVKILWVIDKSWLIQESPGWEPDWFLEMSLLAKKQVNISLKISLSNILPKIGITTKHYVCWVLVRVLTSANYNRYKTIP